MIKSVQLLIVISFMISFCAKADESVLLDNVTVYKHCLYTKNKKTLVEWGTIGLVNENWEASYIKYGKNKKPINIYLASITHIDDQPDARSNWFSRRYIEVINGNITGEYILGTQGNNFVDGSYKNYKTKKVTPLFGEDTFYDACVWEK